MTNDQLKVLGYIKPISAFKTIDEWEQVANTILAFQRLGMDTRAGNFRCTDMLSCSIDQMDAFQGVVMENFGYLLHDVDRFERVVMKNFFNFIEDFVNYRVWGMRKEFAAMLPGVDSLKFSFLYTRDDIEPYVLLDDEFTRQVYGSLDNVKEVMHYTTKSGVERIAAAILRGDAFDISCFTIMDRPFFRSESNVLLKLQANVRAGFRSDVKSFAVEGGRRACNMYRLGYPGNKSNLCTELDSCDSDNLTSLWNEYIATPLRILSVENRGDR